MALPVNIDDLLRRNKVESNRVEFKKGWNPTSIYHTLCAFANDIDGLGGGYVIVGVEEDHGMAKRPVTGIPTSQIDTIQQQMVGLNNLFSPYYMPRVSVEEADGKNLIVIWAPSGANRPYSIRTDVLSTNDRREAFYVRSGTSSIVARGEVLDELRDMASRVPFDGRGNPAIAEDDIDYVLMREYLQAIKSRMVTELKSLDTMELLERMDLLTGPAEKRMIKNVAAMMFSNHPERFFPYTQISVVIFPEGRQGNPNLFSEKTFHGSVPTIIRGAMQYLSDTVITEYVAKPKDHMESDRWLNYPYQALEEAVVNAMYHRDYQVQQEVEISVEPDGIRILSLSGPDRSISDKALHECQVLHSRRYRNNRLGDFLKELGMTEGRSTGIPTIQKELARNGSPRATVETDASRSYFLLHIPVHEGCGKVVEITKKRMAQAEKNTPSPYKRTPKKVYRRSIPELPQNFPGTSPVLPQKLPQDTLQETKAEKKPLSGIAAAILRIIASNPETTLKQLGEALSRTDRTMKTHIAWLKQHGYIRRIGGNKGGYWEILSDEKS